jgi:ribosomal protein S18 acetylase RimI-like enzyme
VPNVKIRRIGRDEWQKLRELRLRALLDAPDAFGSTHDQEANDSEDAWRDWAADGAEDGPGFAAIAVGRTGWVGMAVGAPDREHPGESGLFAMWVDPAVRGEGIGRRLVDEVVEWARSAGFGSIRLRVTTSNNAAVRLYERCGYLDAGDRTPLHEGSDVVTMSMTRSLA